MAGKRKPDRDPAPYVPEPYIVQEADRVLGRVLAALAGAEGYVDHVIDRATRYAMAIVYVTAAGKPVTGLTIILRAYDGPAYGILEGNRVVECEDFGEAVRQVAYRFEAASQLSLAF